jgi:hypothetical protein
MPNVVQFPQSVDRHAAEVARLESIFRAKPASCRVLCHVPDRRHVFSGAKWLNCFGYLSRVRDDDHFTLRSRVI